MMLRFLGDVEVVVLARCGRAEGVAYLPTARPEEVTRYLPRDAHKSTCYEGQAGSVKGPKAAVPDSHGKPAHAAQTC